MDRIDDLVSDGADLRRRVHVAFIGMNDTHDALLASNKVFTLCMVLAIYWIATLIALKGLGWVGKSANGAA